MFWDQPLSDAGGWGGGQGFLWRSDGFHRGMISCCQQSLAGELYKIGIGNNMISNEIWFK